jgi:hypothetical protein
LTFYPEYIEYFLLRWPGESRSRILLVLYEYFQI